MTNPHLPEPVPCPECQAGIMHMRLITYFTWLSHELITVPNFPAWVCDVCSRREYDERAISWLTTLLSPHTGQASSHKQGHIPPSPPTMPPRPTTSK
ncbi:MAG: YgiT-type zinc finger protein [Anaerolineales bacterium]|nr:YgiT-type zinc finger protein [Anaerolineales bacterium]